MEGKNNSGKGPEESGFRVAAVLISVLSPLSAFAVLFFRYEDLFLSLSGALIMLCTGISASCTLLFEKKRGKLSFENASHPLRVIFSFIIGILLAASSGLLPEFLIPLSFFGVLFELITSFVSGVMLFFPVLTLSVLSSGEGGFYFSYYFLTALLIMVLCSHVKERLPVLKSVLVLFFSRIALFTLWMFFTGTGPSPELLFSAAGGLISELVILSLMLPKLEGSVVFPWRERFTELNDPEYELLSSLKKGHRETYIRGIHTAYLSDRLSLKIGADRSLARGIAYYHDIGVLLDPSAIRPSTLELSEAYSFPPALIKCLEEYPSGKSRGRAMGRETSVVYITERIVRAIRDYYFDHPGENADYEEIIDTEFSLLERDRSLCRSALSFEDYSQIKKSLKQEKLYYDFLR
ncbi:MAG: hypothetical protein K5985_11210 [Lachnospiraceae bacterium]|nr:hypothetical protein [Lachnospiraceae bacterium]